jgi:hypothetical protein
VVVPEPAQPFSGQALMADCAGGVLDREEWMATFADGQDRQQVESPNEWASSVWQPTRFRNLD